HYTASPLDHLIFARTFPWSAGRTRYSALEAWGVPAPSKELWLENTVPGAAEARARALGAMSVARQDGEAVSQFFPYEIYGDLYGQRLIPEDMGYVTNYTDKPIPHGYFNEYQDRETTLWDMIRYAKRNRVIRDAWASFFVHTYWLEGSEGKPDPKPLE